MTQYQKYCNLCSEKNIVNPYRDESHFNRSYGIMENEVEPLVIRPKHRSSIDAHAKVVNQIRDARAKKKREERGEPIKKPRAVKPRILTRLHNSVKKISLKDMTPEELKLHKNEIKRKSLVRRKEAGTVKILSEEEREIQRQYARDYYWKNHEVQREKERIRRQNMTPEQKAQVKEAMRKWQEDHREHVNAQAREWKRINRAKKRESINNTSPLQKVS